MDAMFRISLGELTPGFIADLKRIFKDDQELELTIEPVNDFGLNKKESKEECLIRINQVLKKLEKNKSISFTEEELDEFAIKLMK